MTTVNIEERLDRCKWILIHSRMTDSLMFGPFDSAEEAIAWAEERGVQPYPRPLIPTDEPKETVWEGWR